MGEGTAKTTINLSNNLSSYVNSLGVNPIGTVTGTMQEWLGRFKKGETAQITSKIAALVADWRKQYAGVNVTQTELNFLEQIIPSIHDSPQNFIIKLNSLQNQVMTRYNASRSLVGLPELAINQLVDKNLRIPIYSGQAQTPAGGGSATNSGTTSGGMGWTIIQ
jgi:hypothetical protein